MIWLQVNLGFYTHRLMVHGPDLFG